MLLQLCLIFLCLATSLQGSSSGAPTANKIRTLYNSLAPQSIEQHLAFYYLYGDTPEGKRSLKHAWQLMTGSTDVPLKNFSLPQNISKTINGMIFLVTKPMGNKPLLLTEEELSTIESVAKRLPNRFLKGFGAKTEAEVLALPSKEIDLARGLLLSQMDEAPTRMQQIRSYEAMMDMMALQILARINLEASPEIKIGAINQFIFDEMGFRFPPRALYAKDIDRYTFLPTVLDSHRGVCLGVSILYICLAQRLSLPLEMVTPPGHIYIRYRAKNQEINIETTARGIHLDSEEYLNIDTRKLQERTVKEVIGLAHYNQASVYWQKKNFNKAVATYQKALPYLPEDHLLKELLGYNFLFLGEKEEGEKLLKSIRDVIADEAVSKRRLAEDYLQGNVDAEGILTIFQEIDDVRDSILQKRNSLEKLLKKYPKFRTGLLHLAMTWLQLHRSGEALETLEKYHELDARDPTVEYYLAELYLERFDYQKAWQHLKSAEKLCLEREYAPKVLKDLHRAIKALSPE